MDEVGAYEIPLSAYSASGNYAGNAIVEKTYTYSWEEKKNWATTDTASHSYEAVTSWRTFITTGEFGRYRHTSTYEAAEPKTKGVTNSTSDGMASGANRSNTWSESFSVAKNGNYTSYNSGSTYYSRGGSASGMTKNWNGYKNDYDEGTRSEANYEYFTASVEYSFIRKLTTSTTDGQRIAQSSTREMFVVLRTQTTTTVSSTVPTASASSSTSTSTTFSISTFKQTNSTASSRYWEYVTTSGSVQGFSISWSNKSEYSGSSSGASGQGTWSSSYSTSESSSASESSTAFELANLGLNGAFVTVTSSISVLLNDGETYWYVDNSKGDWSAPISKTETSFTSTYEAVFLNRGNTIVGGDGLDKVVYWDNNTYKGTNVEVSSGVTVSGTGYAKARGETYTDTSLLSGRENYLRAYLVRTTSSVTYQYSRTYLTQWPVHWWYAGASSYYSHRFGYTESGSEIGGDSWVGVSATTGSSSLAGLDKWLWGIGPWWREGSPAINLNLDFFPYLNVALTTDTGFVAPDASASFHTKLPEFGDWDGGTASANLFLGVGMPKLDGTSYTWDGSGNGATNANQPPGYTNSNWCIIPRGANNFSSCYKKVNGLFASPLQSRQYAIVGGKVNNFPFTAVLCDREKNYTLSSTVINNALTSGSPAFPEVTVTSSVVDLEMRVNKSAFFDDSFNKRVFEGVDFISANSVQADEAVRWMQGLESETTFVRTYSTSSTSSTSSTQPPTY